MLATRSMAAIAVEGHCGLSSRGLLRRRRAARRLTCLNSLVVNNFALRTLDPTKTNGFSEVVVERHCHASTIGGSKREPAERFSLYSDAPLAQSAIVVGASGAHRHHRGPHTPPTRGAPRLRAARSSMILNSTSRWLHARWNDVVPARWQTADGAAGGDRALPRGVSSWCGLGGGWARPTSRWDEKAQRNPRPAREARRVSVLAVHPQADGGGFVECSLAAVSGGVPGKGDAVRWWGTSCGEVRRGSSWREVFVRRRWVRRSLAWVRRGSRGETGARRAEGGRGACRG